MLSTAAMIFLFHDFLKIFSVPQELGIYKQTSHGNSLMKLFSYHFSKAKQNSSLPEIGRVIFLPLTRPHIRVCIRIYIFNFKKNTKKVKETKEEKISGKSIKKGICVRPDEDFSRHTQTRVFFWPNHYYFPNK